jgi:hypothetical protein
MSLQALYSIIGALCVVAEIVLLVILVVRRQYKAFPVFTCYIAYNLLSDFLIGAAVSAYSMRIARPLQFASLPLQYLLELGVLIEIAWNVLRPVHLALPRYATRVFVSLVILAIIFGTFLAWHVHDTGNQIDDLKGPLDLTVGLLRLLIFAVTAGFAQVLGIGWKNKVLQLATALSFYSAVDLMVTLWERHSGNSVALDPMRSVGYLLELGFLVWAFTTKEVRRGEFSPQMEQFLVTLAGRAKVARTAFVRTQVK